MYNSVLLFRFYFEEETRNTNFDTFPTAILTVFQVGLMMLQLTFGLFVVYVDFSVCRRTTMKKPELPFLLYSLVSLILVPLGIPKQHTDEMICILPCCARLHRGQFFFVWYPYQNPENIPEQRFGPIIHCCLTCCDWSSLSHQIMFFRFSVLLVKQCSSLISYLCQ